MTNVIIKALNSLMLLISCVAAAFGQANSAAELTAAIEKNPANAELYLQRGDLYADSWNSDQKPENIIAIARAAADYSKYLRLKPNDAQVYRRRAHARNELFLGVNSFAIADLRQSFRLNPKDLEARDEIRVQTAEYRKTYQSRECVENRKTNGFQGHPDDTPLTKLAEYLDVEMSETGGGGGNSDALKAIACGANVNYAYKSSGASEFSGFNNYRLEHIIALLEAGAKTESRNRKGETILMQTFDLAAKSRTVIDADFYEKLKIVLQYGANLNAQNRRRQSLLSVAKRTNNAELIKFLREKGAR